ncbi:hypothetical protein [Pseudoduganella sp. UC29_71]|uniref:hypothetical protein n=1 Tax=Pseudoduganella sp. UC29_71 TaxID=3350174 RepID=UPI00366D8439
MRAGGRRRWPGRCSSPSPWCCPSAGAVAKPHQVVVVVVELVPFVPTPLPLAWLLAQAIAWCCPCADAAARRHLVAAVVV